MGETIVVTFPSGGIGLVDAHPSAHSFRPDILQIVDGKTLHFVCLTHPHADHGVDLVKVLQQHGRIEAFWHTIFDLPAFIYGIEQIPNFPSVVREHAARMNQNWAEFLFDIFDAVIEREIPRHHLRSDLEAQLIDGVEIHCLAPEESIQNSFSSAYFKRLTDPSTDVPDPNLISAVLALKFGQAVVLLGADALKKNWESAVDLYRRRNLPKAQIVKVPHHGAKNALNLRHNARNYLDVCSRMPRANTVIFGGDAKHPDHVVFNKLRDRTEPICLTNGRKSGGLPSNPLQLQLPGARAVLPALVCNPVVSFEIDAQGTIDLIAGVGCQGGCFKNS